MTVRETGLGIALAAVLVLPAGRGWAQEGPPLVIQHADQFERRIEQDTLFYDLTGNVRAHRGPLYMRSRRAVINRTSGVADFTGDVHFWDATTELYADHVVYTEATDVAVATGDVQVIDRESGSNVKADTVRYDRRLELVTAWPRPHAVLIPRDTTDQVPFDLYADLMRFVSDSTRQEFVAVDRVLIERPDLTAIGDSLYYDERNGRVALRDGPQVETREVYLTAGTIDLLLEENEIESLVALDEARAVQKGDSIPPAVPPAFENVAESSFLEGDSLHIDFLDEAIERLLAHGRARSLNYQRESDAGAIETWSVNYLLGHTLTLNFRGDTLEVVRASEGARGIYRQEQVRIGGPVERESEPIPLPRWDEPVALHDRRRSRR